MPKQRNPMAHSDNRIDYKYLIVDKIKELFNLLPDYNTGDILYSAFRKVGRQGGCPVAFLRELSDEQIYQLLDNVIYEEFEKYNEE